MATPKETKIRPEMIRSLVDYNPATGDLRWKARDVSLFADGDVPAARAAKIWNTQNAGKLIRVQSGSGYYIVAISIFGRDRYGAHRVAWCHYHGSWPNGIIDHINGNRADNRISNLRDCTQHENGRNRGVGANNTSGKNGVSFSNNKKRWRAMMKVSGKNIHLGYHKAFSDAVLARLDAEEKYGFCEAGMIGEDAPKIRRLIEKARPEVEEVKRDERHSDALVRQDRRWYKQFHARMTRAALEDKG